MGIDVNPLAVFVARVKLSPLPGGGRRRRRSLPRPLRGRRRRRGPLADPGPADRRARCSSPTSSTPSSGCGRWSRSGPPRRSSGTSCSWPGWPSSSPSAATSRRATASSTAAGSAAPGGYVARPDGQWQLARFGPDQTAFVWAAFRRQLAGMLADGARLADGPVARPAVIEGDALDAPRVAARRRRSTRSSSRRRTPTVSTTSSRRRWSCGSAASSTATPDSWRCASGRCAPISAPPSTGPPSTGPAWTCPRSTRSSSAWTPAPRRCGCGFPPSSGATSATWPPSCATAAGSSLPADGAASSSATPPTAASSSRPTRSSPGSVWPPGSTRHRWCPSGT